MDEQTTSENVPADVPAPNERVPHERAPSEQAWGERDRPGRKSAHTATFLVRQIGSLGRELDTVMQDHLTVNPTDMRAMSTLLGRGPMTVSELADTLGLGRPATSMSVDRLVHLGHVSRERDEVDRRRVTIRATPGSAAKARDALLPMIREIDGLLESMAKDERDVVHRYLQSVTEAMQRQIDSIRTADEKSHR